MRRGLAAVGPDRNYGPAAPVTRGRADPHRHGYTP